jgi:hypothetical protein
VTHKILPRSSGNDGDTSSRRGNLFLRGNNWQRSGITAQCLSLPEAPTLCRPRQRLALNLTEQLEWLGCLLLFCFCRSAYVLHQHKAGISARHRSKKHVRGMLPTFAENNSVTIYRFNSVCSRIAPSSVGHVRRFLKATACNVSF